MTFFVHNCWQLLTKLEIYGGLWPFQNRLKNYLMRVFLVFIMVAGVIPMGNRLIKELGVNPVIMTENITGILLINSILTKILMASIHNEERKKLYQKVKFDHETITEPGEAFVLNKFSQHAHRFCIKYLFVHLGVFSIFFCSPLPATIIKALINKSGLEKVLPYHVDYSCFFDEDKYYPIILLHTIVIPTLFAIVNMAVDFALIMQSRHVCALFEIVKMRLREASGFLDEFEYGMLDFETANDKAYELIKKAIDVHNEAFEFVSLIEEIYNFCLLVAVLEGTFSFSGGTYMILLNLNNPFDLIRYSAFIGGMLTHFFIPFIHGQMIIDASSSVFDTCYNIKWYVASRRIKVLISIMMSRSSKPCALTGGRFFIISFDIVGKMVKAGFSYFSVFYR